MWSRLKSTQSCPKFRLIPTKSGMGSRLWPRPNTSQRYMPSLSPPISEPAGAVRGSHGRLPSQVEEAARTKMFQEVVGLVLHRSAGYIKAVDAARTNTGRAAEDEITRVAEHGPVTTNTTTNSMYKKDVNNFINNTVTDNSQHLPVPYTTNSNTKNNVATDMAIDLVNKKLSIFHPAAPHFVRPIDRCHESFKVNVWTSMKGPIIRHVRASHTIVLNEIANVCRSCKKDLGKRPTSHKCQFSHSI